MKRRLGASSYFHWSTQLSGHSVPKSAARLVAQCAPPISLAMNPSLQPQAPVAPISWYRRVAIAPAGFVRLGLSHERALGVALLLCALAFWFASRPFRGTRHDSIFYRAQALLQVQPETFLSDLFFAYGSQDQFSIYSSLYAWAADIAGWGLLSPVVLFACQLAFLVALILLLRELVPLALAALGLVVLAVAPYYGSYQIFSVGEPFLTARSIAEPLMLFAVLCMVKERYATSFGLSAIALLFHPLMALVGFGMLFVLFAERYRRLWWLLLVIPVAIVLGYLEVPLFQKLVLRYDDAWYEPLSYNLFVFPEYWRGQDWAKVVFDATILGLATRLARPDHARMLRALLLVAAVALLVTAVGAGIMRLQLVTQAQFWRAQWLAHLLACGLFPWIIWRLRDRGPALWLGLTLILAGLSFRGQPTSVLVMVGGSIALVAALLEWKPSTGKFAGFVLLAALATFIAALANDLSITSHLSEISFSDSVQERTRRLFGTPSLALLLIAGCVIVALRVPRVVIVLAALGFGAALLTWDQRSEWHRYLDQSPVDQDHVFARHIPKNAQVYWVGELAPTWMLLKRPNYFSTSQASGILFNRATAIEFARREELTAELESQIAICHKLAPILKTCSPQPATLDALCRREGGPDFVILDWKFDGLYIDQWRKVFSDEGLREHFLYDCKQIAQGTVKLPAVKQSAVKQSAVKPPAVRPDAMTQDGASGTASAKPART